jgi:hypothetical protein
MHPRALLEIPLRPPVIDASTHNASHYHAPQKRVDCHTSGRQSQYQTCSAIAARVVPASIAFNSGGAPGKHLSGSRKRSDAESRTGEPDIALARGMESARFGGGMSTGFATVVLRAEPLSGRGHLDSQILLRLRWPRVFCAISDKSRQKTYVYGAIPRVTP